MATINIGSLSLSSHKGDYDNSTAYVKNDVVYYATTGSAYIAKQATTGNLPTSTAHWNIFVQKGTDADLASISGTVQGDLYYNNGSAIARLAPGTAGQVLKTGGASANPVWGTDAGGSILAVSHKMYGGTNEINTQNRTSNFTFTSNSYEISNLTHTLTPSSNTSKFLFQLNLQACHSDSYTGIGWLTYQVQGGTEYAIASSGSRGVTFRFDDGSVGSSNAGNPSVACCVMIAPATTSDVTFRIRIASPSSNYPWYINRTPGNNTDVDDGGYMLSTSTVYELDGSKSTKGTNSVDETKT